MSLSAPGPETRVYSPAELNREVRVHLEAGFPRLWIAGEISNLARPPSGHLYFSIKDERAQIRCALFRRSAAGLGFRPENGMQVLARGRLGLYEPRGDYQLIADGLLEAGAGALARAFEALKKKLEAEGLFDQARKKDLPRWPERISVVTSPSGAAIRDILHVLARRWPRAQVRIYPSQVQGEQAPAELVRALKAADLHGFGDVILLTRGGGSLEDLWAFNNESLARTIADCQTPVISGVGHETDFTIADFVADLRAPTPTAAAVAATPDGPALAIELERRRQRFGRAMEQAMQQRAQKLDNISGRLLQQHPERRLTELLRRQDELSRRLGQAMQRLTDDRQQRFRGLHARLLAGHPRRQLQEFDLRLKTAHRRMTRAVNQSMEQRRHRFSALVRALNGVSPLGVLQRGYALVRTPDNRLLTKKSEFEKGKNINILMNDFEVDAEITGTPREVSLK